MTTSPEPVGYLPGSSSALVGRAPEVAVDNALSQGSHLSRRNPCPTNLSHLYDFRCYSKNLSYAITLFSSQLTASRMCS